MTASVFDYDTLTYDYYEVPGKASMGGWDDASAGLGRSSGAAKGGMGQALEALLPVLPAGALKTGRGERARGRVMVRGGGALSQPLGAAPVDLPWTRLALVGIGVLVVVGGYVYWAGRSP